MATYTNPATGQQSNVAPGSTIGGGLGGGGSIGSQIAAKKEASGGGGGGFTNFDPASKKISKPGEPTFESAKTSLRIAEKIPKDESPGQKYVRLLRTKPGETRGFVQELEEKRFKKSFVSAEEQLKGTGVSAASVFVAQELSLIHI